MANKISVLIDVAVDGATRNLKSFRTAVADADTATGKFKAGAGAAMDSVKANAGNLALAGGAALIAFGAKSVAAFQDTALEAGKLRDSLGVTAEEASRLMEVAEDLGIGTETLEKSIGIMNRTATNTPGAFSAIGAELKKNADGTTNVNATFLSTIDALKKIPDASQRAAAAQKVFGRGWMEMAELIELGADGVEKALASVESGKIIDDGEVQSAREFRDALDTLKGAGEELAITVGSFLVPVLTDAAEATADVKDTLQGLEDAIPGPVKWIGKLAEANFKYLNPVSQGRKAFGFLADQFRDTEVAATNYTAAQDLIAESIAAGLDDFKKADSATRVYGTAMDLVADSIADATAAENEHRAALNASRTARIEAFDSGLAYRNQVANTTQTVREASMVQLDAARTDEERAQAARDAEGAVLDQASAAVQFASDQAEANGQTLTAKDKADLYRNELIALAAQLDGPARQAIDLYILSLGRIPKSVNTSVTTTLGTRFTPGYTPQARASGGPVSSGQTYLVGEEGPELLQMGNTSGNIVPNDKLTGGGGNTYVTVNTQADPQMVIDAIRKWERRNGGLR